MKSFCLQIARILYGNIIVSYLWKVTVVGDILIEQQKYTIYTLFRLLIALSHTRTKYKMATIFGLPFED